MTQKKLILQKYYKKIMLLRLTVKEEEEHNITIHNLYSNYLVYESIQQF